jgi:sugar/nucleoside kinase (ribokinase family)
MRVLSVGGCTLDHIGVVERFLDANASAEMPKFSVQGGGCAATAVVALARWGVETRFVGKVGDDTRGNLIRMTLADEGVDTFEMIRETGAVSQFRFIVVERGTGRKQTLYTRGSVSALMPEEVDVAVLNDVDLLLVDGTQKAPQLKLMRAAREHGIPVVFEAKRNQRDVEELVSASDVLVASERFASQFAGVGRLERLCEVLLERGPSRVIVTMGDEGVVGMERADGRMIRQGPHPVELVNTTGAGDVFMGATAYGMLHQWEFERVLQFANKAAALSCTDIGGRSAIYPVDEISRA